MIYEDKCKRQIPNWQMFGIYIKLLGRGARIDVEIQEKLDGIHEINQ